MLPRLVALNLLFSLAALAQDVHIHVSPTSHGNTNSTDDFPTVQMAMDHAPEPGPKPGKDGQPARLFLHIAPGTYHERVIVTQNRPNTTFLGEGPDPSAVTISAKQNARSAGGTFFTETVRVDAPGFEADNLTIENTAGNTGQAVALANLSDRSVVKHCRLLGHQDTLFADFGRQLYLDDFIEGTVDFIFGNATAVFDHTEIHELAPAYLTAQSRTSPRQTTGFVILGSRITSDLSSQAHDPDFAHPTSPNDVAAAPAHFFLGRPWRAYARTVVIGTELPANLAPEGWSVWKGNNNHQTAFYAESANTGPGAGTSGRVRWSHQLTPAQVRPYLPQNFLAGPPSGPQHWNPLAAAARLP